LLSFEAALALIKDLLDPVLSGQLGDGAWNPRTRSWE
jgi:hypothetical protein